MWHHFTDSARKVMFYAVQEAQRFGTSRVDTEHLLLGLLRDGKEAAGVWPPPPSTRVDSAGVAAHLLGALGLEHEALWQEVTRHATVNEAPRADGDVKLSLLAKSVIIFTIDEARQLNSPHIGTEHLLLGLTGEGEGLAGRILAERGVTLERARREVAQLQGVPAPDATPDRPWWHIFRP